MPYDEEQLYAQEAQTKVLKRLASAVEEQNELLRELIDRRK